jgi:hypothetical protein
MDDRIRIVPLAFQKKWIVDTGRSTDGALLADLVVIPSLSFLLLLR